MRRYKRETEEYKEYFELTREAGLEPDADAPCAPVKPPPARPILIVLIPELISQFYREVSSFSTDFHPYVYHGDMRENIASQMQKISGKLSRKHPIFDKRELNSKILILTSLPTLRARHGPTALKNYRVAELGFSPPDAIKLKTTMDNDWPYNLNGLFELVVVDECQQLKTLDNASHITMSWLQTPFLLGASASLVPNRIEDIHGYSPFLVPNGDALWETANLEKLG